MSFSIETRYYFVPLSYFKKVRHVIIFIVKFLTDPNNFNPLFDVREFRGPQFQRVYQYLKLSKEGADLDNFTFVPGNIDGDQKTCLTLLLRFGK